MTLWDLLMLIGGGSALFTAIQMGIQKGVIGILIGIFIGIVIGSLSIITTYKVGHRVFDRLVNNAGKESIKAKIAVSLMYFLLVLWVFTSAFISRYLVAQILNYF